MRIPRIVLVVASAAVLALVAAPAHGAGIGGVTQGVTQATQDLAKVTQDLTSVQDIGGAGSELSGPRPDWYTPELHADVVAAAERGEGVPLPDGVDYPTSALVFSGIRPGSWMISPAGCTMNFVFGEAPRYFIGTAGHCTEVGDEVTIIALPGVLMNIGTTVRSVDNGIGDDFALVEIRPEMIENVNPSMAYFGGPTDVGSPQFGDVVEHVGHGIIIGTGGTPRAGVVVFRGLGDAAGSDAFAWDGAASPGDSGSPVRLLNGTGAGDLTHLIVGGPYFPGVIAGTSIERMLEIAGEPLATAPNVPAL